MKLFIFWMHIIQTDNLHSKAQYSSLLPSTAQNIPVRTVQYSPVAAQHIPLQYSPLQSTSAQLQPIILANTVTTVPHHPFQKPRSLLFLVLQPTAQCWSSFNRYNFKSRNQQWMMSDKYFCGYEWCWILLLASGASLTGWHCPITLGGVIFSHLIHMRLSKLCCLNA